MPTISYAPSGVKGLSGGVEWRERVRTVDVAYADLGAEVEIADGEDQRFGECKLLMVAVPSTESAPYFVSQSQGFVQRERTDAVFKQQ